MSKTRRDKMRNGDGTWKIYIRGGDDKRVVVSRKKRVTYMYKWELRVCWTSELNNSSPYSPCSMYRRNIMCICIYVCIYENK